MIKIYNNNQLRHGKQNYQKIYKDFPKECILLDRFIENNFLGFFTGIPEDSIECYVERQNNFHFSQSKPYNRHETI